MCTRGSWPSRSSSMSVLGEGLCPGGAGAGMGPAGTWAQPRACQNLQGARSCTAPGRVLPSRGGSRAPTARGAEPQRSLQEEQHRAGLCQGVLGCEAWLRRGTAPGQAALTSRSPAAPRGVPGGSRASCQQCGSTTLTFPEHHLGFRSLAGFVQGQGRPAVGAAPPLLSPSALTPSCVTEPG